jgi:hypothetical protein
MDDERTPGVVPVQGDPTTYPTPPVELSMSQARPYISNVLRAFNELRQWQEYASRSGWSFSSGQPAPMQGFAQEISQTEALLVQQRMSQLSVFVVESNNFLRTHGWRTRGEGQYANIPITATSHWDWWNRFPIVPTAPAYPSLKSGLTPRPAAEIAPPVFSVNEYTVGQQLQRPQAQLYIDQYIQVWTHQQNARDQALSGGWLIAGSGGRFVGEPQEVQGYQGTRIPRADVDRLALQWRRDNFFITQMRLFLEDHGWGRTSANPSEWSPRTIANRPGGNIQMPPTMPVGMLLTNQPPVASLPIQTTGNVTTPWGDVTVVNPFQFTPRPLMITWIRPGQGNGTPGVIQPIGPVQTSPGIYSYNPFATQMHPNVTDYSTVNQAAQNLARAQMNAWIAQAQQQGTLGTNIPIFNVHQFVPIFPWTPQYNNTQLMLLEAIIDRNLAPDGRTLNPMSQWVATDIQLFNTFIGSQFQNPTISTVPGDLSRWTPQALLNPANNDALVYILGKNPLGYQTWADYFASVVAYGRPNPQIPPQTLQLLSFLGNTPTGQSWATWFGNQVQNYNQSMMPLITVQNVYNSQFLTNPINNQLMNTLLGPISNYPATTGFQNWSQYWQSIITPQPTIQQPVPIRPLSWNIGGPALTLLPRPIDPLQNGPMVVVPPRPPQLPPVQVPQITYNWLQNQPTMSIFPQSRPLAITQLFLPSDPCRPNILSVMPFNVNSTNLQYTIKNITFNVITPQGQVRPTVIGQAASALDTNTGRLYNLIRVLNPNNPNQIIEIVRVRAADGSTIQRARLVTPNGPTPNTQPRPVMTFRGYVGGSARGAGINMLAHAIGTLIGQWLAQQLGVQDRPSMKNQYITMSAYSGVMQNLRGNPTLSSNTYNLTIARFYRMTDPNSSQTFTLTYGDGGMAASNWLGVRESTSCLSDFWYQLRRTNITRYVNNFINCAQFMENMIQYFRLTPPLEVALEKCNLTITGDNVLTIMRTQTYFLYVCAADWENIKELRYACLKNELTSVKKSFFDRFNTYYWNAHMWDKGEMVADLNWRHPTNRESRGDGKQEKYDYHIRELDNTSTASIIAREQVETSTNLMTGYGQITRNLMRVRCAATYVTWYLFTLNGNEPTDVTQVLDQYITRCQEVEIAMLDFMDKCQYGLIRADDFTIRLNYPTLTVTKACILIKEGIDAINSLPQEVRNWNEWRVFSSLGGQQLENNTFGSAELGRGINQHATVVDEQLRTDWTTSEYANYQFYLYKELDIPKPSTLTGSWENWWLWAKQEGIADGQRSRDTFLYQQGVEQQIYVQNVQALIDAYVQMNPDASVWTLLPQAYLDPQSLQDALSRQLQALQKLHTDICFGMEDCECFRPNPNNIGTLRGPRNDTLPSTQPVVFGLVDNIPLYAPVSSQSILDGVNTITELTQQNMLDKIQAVADMQTELKEPEQEPEESINSNLGTPPSLITLPSDFNNNLNNLASQAAEGTLSKDELTSQIIALNNVTLSNSTVKSDGPTLNFGANTLDYQLSPGQVDVEIMSIVNMTSIKVSGSPYKNDASGYNGNILNQKLWNDMSIAFPSVNNIVSMSQFADGFTIKNNQVSVQPVQVATLQSIYMNLGLNVPDNVSNLKPTDDSWTDTPTCICPIVQPIKAFGALYVYGSDLGTFSFSEGSDTIEEAALYLTGSDWGTFSSSGGPKKP